jgi:hypothetical protein
MNTARIAALARRVARRHTAGLIKPPPVMVEAIYKWAAACLALSEIARRKQYKQERAQGYDRQAALRNLEGLIARVRKSPTKWKVYSEYAKATMMFGYGPWGSLAFKQFTKLTPEGEADLRGRVEEDLHAAEGRMEAEREQERENIAREVAETAKLQHIVSEGSTYSPGPAPQTRVFPLDLTGWKYDAARFQALLEKQQAAQVKMVEDALEGVRENAHLPEMEALLMAVKKNPRWRNIKVMLADNIQGTGTGSWVAGTHTLAIKTTNLPLLNTHHDTLGNLHDTVYHELQHMTQSFMAYALWDAEFDQTKRRSQPGFPRPEARTPQYNQHSTPTREVGRDALHALDDIEFHTDLQGQLTFYKRTLARNPDMTSEQKRILFDHFISRKVAPREWGRWSPPVEPSHFFTTLKKYAPKKYIEAVQELAAAVL